VPLVTATVAPLMPTTMQVGVTLGSTRLRCVGWCIRPTRLPRRERQPVQPPLQPLLLLLLPEARRQRWALAAASGRLRCGLSCQERARETTCWHRGRLRRRRRRLRRSYHYSSSSRCRRRRRRCSSPAACPQPRVRRGQRGWWVQGAAAAPCNGKQQVAPVATAMAAAAAAAARPPLPLPPSLVSPRQLPEAHG
jgi:hypothetical protein